MFAIQSETPSNIFSAPDGNSYRLSYKEEQLQKERGFCACGVFDCSDWLISTVHTRTIYDIQKEVLTSRHEKDVLMSSFRNK
jgi:hypothetical protein